MNPNSIVNQSTTEQVQKQIEEQPADPSLQYPSNFPPTPPSGGSGITEGTIVLALVLFFLTRK